MSARKFLAVFSLVLLMSSSRSPIVSPEPAPAVEIEVLTVYEVAEELTGAPAQILRAIAITESGEDDAAVGDGGRSRGRMQINEDYRSERVAKYGEYDPHNPLDAAIISGHIYAENLVRLGSEEKAIAAHRQGAKGVRENGPTQWYVKRVKGGVE